MVNYRLKSQILEVVENQLIMNDPKCTMKTLNRLVGLGYEVEEAKEMIAAVVAEEMFYIVKHEQSFNEKSYEKKLSLLPDYIESIENNGDSMVKTKPVRVGPTFGRNKPCPCGSGKKYKKCCGK